MSKEKFALLVCEEQDEGAMPLFESLSGERAVLYVKKTPCAENLSGYALAQSAASGFGYSYGTAKVSPSGDVKVLPADPEKIVLDKDGSTVIGYAYTGSYYSDSNGDIKSYAKKIFLALGEQDRWTGYDYQYRVFPFDGTSSEYSHSDYTGFIKQ